MTRSATWAALVMLSMIGAARAQTSAEVSATPSTSDKKTLLAVMVLGAQPLGLGVSLERAFAPRWSAEGQVALLGAWANASEGAGSAQTSTFGGAPSVALHFFPGAHAPDGFWFGPSAYASYVRQESSAGGATSTASQLGGGARAMVGYNFVTARGFSATVGFGLGLAYSASDLQTAGTSSGTATGLSLGTAIQLGLGWSI